MSLEALNQLLEKGQLDDFMGLFDQALRGGGDVSQVFDLSRRLCDSLPMHRTLEILKRDPAAQRLIAERALMPKPQLEELLALPRGSVGRTYGGLLQRLHYDPGFYPDPAYFNNLATDADYVNYRTYATHDLHHVLTGFALDTTGELGVISVSIRQYGCPAFAFLALTSLFASWMASPVLYTPGQPDAERVLTARYRLELIDRGMAIGDAAKPLFALDWPNLLSRDLEELRQELGVEPLREGPGSWYSRPELMAALG
jgi:ubiquinone biosynthesis protein Coq4